MRSLEQEVLDVSLHSKSNSHQSYDDWKKEINKLDKQKEGLEQEISLLKQEKQLLEKKIEKLKVATRVLLFIALSFSLCIGLFPNLNGLLLNNAIGSSFSFDFNVSLIVGIIFLIAFIIVSIVFNKTDNFMKLNKEYVKKIQSKQ